MVFYPTIYSIVPKVELPANVDEIFTIELGVDVDEVFILTI